MQLKASKAILRSNVTKCRYGQDSDWSARGNNALCRGPYIYFVACHQRAWPSHRLNDDGPPASGNLSFFPLTISTQVQNFMKIRKLLRIVAPCVVGNYSGWFCVFICLFTCLFVCLSPIFSGMVRQRGLVFSTLVGSETEP